MSDFPEPVGIRGAPELGSGRVVSVEKAWPEPELCYFQRVGISNLFIK
jgi:hypothetical protein